jgi:hypothetical protein
LKGTTVAKIFIGMETSGQVRRRLRAMGHQVVSCDTLQCTDDCVTIPATDLNETPDLWLHVTGDVFVTLGRLREIGWAPDAALFHPTCTLHTVAAAWAFSEPNFERYPGVGYHQRVKPETLTGHARHEARAVAEAEVERIADLPFFKIIENPKNTWPTRTSLMEPFDVLQPYEFGDDASKATCVWAFDEDGNWKQPVIPRDPAKYVEPTYRPRTGKRYWANQTDTGQNRVSPSDDRWSERSKTYDGIADALAGALNRIVSRL